MKRAHIALAGILCLNLSLAGLSEAVKWLYMPDGVVPVGFQFLLHPLFHWLSLIMLLFLWLYADAKARNLQLPFTTLVLVPILFPIGIPIYFFRTYPSSRAFVQTGFALAFSALFVGALWLGRNLVFNYYAVWTNK